MQESAVVKDKLWTKNYVVIFIVVFAVIMTYFMLLTTIAQATKTLGATAAQGGIAAGIFVVGCVIGRLIGPTLMASMSNKKLVLILLFVAVVFSCGYIIANSMPVMYLVRMLHGIAWACAINVAMAMCFKALPQKRMGEGITWLTTGIAIAGALGPVAGLTLMQSRGAIGNYLGAVALGVFAMIFASIYEEKPVTIPAGAKPAQSAGFSLDKFIAKRALPIGIIVLVIYFGFNNVNVYMAGYTAQLGLVQMAQMYFIIQTVVMVILRLMTRKVVDTRGANWMMYPCMICLIIGTYLLANVGMLGAGNVLPMFVAADVFTGIGIGGIYPTAQAIAIQMVEPKDTPVGTSTCNVMQDIGMGLGPMLIGGFAGTQGISFLFMIVCGTAVLGLALYILVHGRKISNRTVDYLQGAFAKKPAGQTADGRA